ncbi:MAG: hypothetical protein HWD82_04485 [Flavobacteriaceae bacterium]|nr:hypothetical protein [Flavobacteriaceae bacterium]
MKISMHVTIAVTTFLLFLITIMASLNFSFSWVFFLTVIGQVSLVYMVYRVLIDKYSTKKIFDDFYEDNPISNTSEELNYRK